MFDVHACKASFCNFLIGDEEVILRLGMNKMVALRRGDEAKAENYCAY